MTDAVDEYVAGRQGHFLDELRAVFENRASEVALIYKDLRLTYEHLRAKANGCSEVFRKLGVVAGDRVAIATPEKLPFLAAHLGAMYAAAVSLPLNPRLTRDELRYYLDDSGAKVIVAGKDQLPIVDSLRPELPQLRAIMTDSEAWDASPGSFTEQSPPRDAPCLMLYSSGTTGQAKGVVHTHANLASSLRALQQFWRFTPDDVLVNVLPLFHIHGLSFATHLSLLTGSCMFMEDTFHPRRTLEAVSRGTVFMAIPTFYYSFLERPEFPVYAQGWSKVRLFTCGSAPIRAEVLPNLERALGRPVINRYGMTEAHVITSLPLDGPWPGGSVGLPLAGIEVRIRPEAKIAAEPDEVGSVQLRSPNLFREYWRRPESTHDAYKDGWFDTGDLGYRDARGFLTLVGRKHDLIITNGLNVYPQVVERVINECPGVRESAVFGVADKRRGERVAAAVARSDPQLSERSLRSYLGERLVDYQRPADLYFVAELPRNAMGKVLRRELRERLAGS
jgi:malonyl-CoA/methylmalonyl-CoA synthetase